MHSIVLAVWFIGAIAHYSVDKNHELAFKPVTGAFFALSVPNMAQSVEWYSEKFGLDVILEAHDTPQVTVLEGGDLIVELIHDSAAQPGPAQPELQHGVFKAGFFVKDFEATIKELRARDVTIAFGPYPAQGNQRANVLIRDNAGNLIQIFGD